MNSNHGVGVAIIKQDKILLVKHGESAGQITGIYGIPAGRLEDGETDKQAAVRELKEETGFILAEKDLVEYPNNLYRGKYERKDGVTPEVTLHVFAVKNFIGELTSSDETEPGWVDISLLDTYYLLPNIKQIAEDVTRFWTSQNDDVFI